jgi:hypothetical protein
VEDMRLKLSLLEREFFAESRDKKSVKGHEPAIIETPEQIMVGRVINPERLRQAEFIDTLLFETLLPIVSARYELADLIGNSHAGQNWLRQFREHFLRYHGEQISETLEVTPMQMPPLKYGWISEDYFETNISGQGILRAQPAQMAYVKIIPPLKYKTGEWISRVMYERLTIFSDGQAGSFNTHDPSEPQHHNSEGVLLGYLREQDLLNKFGDFGQFPAKHFLTVSYPAGISDLKEVKPLEIRFGLAED